MNDTTKVAPALAAGNAVILKPSEDSPLLAPELLRIALAAEDMFGRVAAAGIACWFGFQTFQNIGMCLGIMPVTGVPLPLVSYGGSSMFASLAAVGLLLNISRRPGPVSQTRR